MQIKTLLNRIEKYKSFVYRSVCEEVVKGVKALIVEIVPRRNSRGRCPVCQRRCPTYDTQSARLYEYVPLWGIAVYFRYRPRRVNCRVDGIHVEWVPWSQGKQRQTGSYQRFLARWAKRLSWSETAEVFQTSWDSVYRAVKSVVEYGLTHRDLETITQIGVDEIAVFKGHQYLTLVYQLDAGCRRLIWCGAGHSAKTLLRFFRFLGTERSQRLKAVCSDMWAAYLKVIKKKAPHALNILDRFHIMKKFNEAIDQERRDEVKRLKAQGEESVLIRSRWILLKRPARLSEPQTARLSDLVKANLSCVKAYLMREEFQRFWEYQRAAWASKFLDQWIDRAMNSQIEPMKKVAKSLRKHQPLILNWFQVGGTLSSGAVEGFNNKAKLTIKKAYGFRSLEHLKIALYHTLGDLPEPPMTHRFC